MVLGITFVFFFWTRDNQVNVEFKAVNKEGG